MSSGATTGGDASTDKRSGDVLYAEAHIHSGTRRSVARVSSVSRHGQATTGANNGEDA